MAAPRPATPAIGFIETLRGAAALAVVLFHTQLHLVAGQRPDDRLVQAVTWWTTMGWMDLGKVAVATFFLISGYLIPATLRRAGPRATALRRFVIHRGLRLYPAYWAAIALMLWVQTRPTVGGAPPWHETLVNLTMLQGFVGVPNMIGVFWTLQIELVFYVTCAGLYALGWLDRRGALVGAALGLALLLAAARFASGRGWPVALGLGLALMFLGDALRGVRDGTQSPAGARRLVAAVVVMLVPVCVLAYGDAAARYVATYWTALALFLACWARPDAFPGGGVRARVSRLLGDTSYGTYLLHAPVTLLVTAWLLPQAPSAWTWHLAVTAPTVALAWLSYRWVEAPAMRLARRWAP